MDAINTIGRIFQFKAAERGVISLHNQNNHGKKNQKHNVKASRVKAFDK